MDKLILTNQSELDTMIFEGIKKALAALNIPNDEAGKPPTGSRADVMKYLNVSSSTLQRLTQTGEIKSFKIGASVRYKWNDIQNYINSKG